MIETTDDSIRRFRKRHNASPVPSQRSYTKIKGDEAEAATPIQKQRPVLDDPDKMLLDRGLDPEDWYIDNDRGITLNEWGDPDDLNYQVKFTAKRKRPELQLQPVRSDGWVRPFITPRLYPEYPELVVICGDHQAPHHDEQLDALFCRWLEANRPDRGVNLGDLLDLGEPSRHPADPENVAATQEGLQAGYNILRGHVDASPETEWELLPGNHDQRLREYLLKYAPYLYGLRQVSTDGLESEEVLGLTHLLRLDELGIKFIEPVGPYEDAQVDLSQYLAVRHGWVVRAGGGASALKTLEQTGFSILVGHTHRQSIVQHTVHDIDRKPKTLLAAEIGCMCRIDSGRDDKGRRFPSYTVFPDWQQGFCVASIWPDGKFKIDLAQYVGGVLLYRDQRYEL